MAEKSEISVRQQLMTMPTNEPTEITPTRMRPSLVRTTISTLKNDYPDKGFDYKTYTDSEGRFMVVRTN
jgi:hypothetical protein